MFHARFVESFLCGNQDKISFIQAKMFSAVQVNMLRHMLYSFFLGAIILITNNICFSYLPKNVLSSSLLEVYTDHSDTGTLVDWGMLLADDNELSSVCTFLKCLVYILE